MAKARLSVGPRGKKTYALTMGPKEAATLVKLYGTLAPGGVKNVEAVRKALSRVVDTDDLLQVPNLALYSPVVTVVPASDSIEREYDNLLDSFPGTPGA